jgi:hypothetical protein
MNGKKSGMVLCLWFGLGLSLVFTAFGNAFELWRDISLGPEIQTNGIQLVSNPDGLWQVTELGGQSCIEMQPNPVSKSASLYFAVDDAYIFNNAHDVFLSIDYFDRGAGFLTIEFDDGAQPYKQAANILLKNQNKWVKQTFNLSQVGFTNQQANAADFRLTIADTALALPALKRIYVWRAPGPYIAPQRTDFSGESFTRNDDLVFTYFFYWYDIYSGAHIWDNAERTDDALQDHPASLEDFSFKSVAWHKRELRDMLAAKIDVILPIYWGSAQEMATWSVEGLEKLVQAEQELLAEGIIPPKIGLFFDTSTLQYGEYVLRSETTPIDLNTALGRAFFFKQIRDFFSLIPPALWARIDGKPVVWLYAAGFTTNANQTLVNYVNEHFATSFPTLQPYIVRETSWNMQTDNDYAWGAALNGAQICGVAGVGPGYNDSAVPGRTTPIRDREAGDFYRRNWEQVLGSGRHLAVVETWNELHEGTDICDSREYGRQYIELTAESATKFKQTTKFFAFEPQRWAGVLQPTCSLSVQDQKIGILPESAASAYSEDGGKTWRPWPATCSGPTGTKSVAQIVARQVPFTQNASMAATPNYIRFSMVNAAGDTVTSPAFTVFNGRPPDYIARITLGAPPQFFGITQSFQQNDDGWSAATTLGGVPCGYNLVANPSPYAGRYLYFNIADSLVFAGSHAEAWITIDYYDTSATGRIELQYDSEGTELSHKYKAGGSVNPSNTRRWKSASFYVKPVYFGNRQNGISDFRFYTSGVMFLSRVSVRSTEAVGVGRQPGKGGALLPEAIRLSQNYPNPFNQTTRIRFDLAQPGSVRLTIFDVQGRQVQTLADRVFAAGTHQSVWDGCNRAGEAVASGVYLCALEAGAQREIRRLVLLR